MHLTNFSINKRNVNAYVKNDTRGASHTGRSAEREGGDETGDKNDEDPE